jgi:hypothetical protein
VQYCNTALHVSRPQEGGPGSTCYPALGFHSTHPYEPSATITTDNLKVRGLLYAVGILLHTSAYLGERAPLGPAAKALRGPSSAVKLVTN